MKKPSRPEELNSKGFKSNDPLVVELIGLAGAGKTSLARALNQRDASINLADDIKLRKLPHLSVFASQFPFTLLEFIHSTAWIGRRPTWDELKTMVYLQEWPRVLRNEATEGCTTILLDHGPIFKLAKLHAFGPEFLHTPAFEPWWHRICEQWAHTLDIAIWIEAPYEVLLTRINSRNQKHAIKGSSELEAKDFLLRYRTSYRQILVYLTMHASPRLIQIDTHQSSIDQVVDEILAACKVRYIHDRATPENAIHAHKVTV